jgi:hypothetical protein
LTGHILYMNCLLKHVTERQKAGEEEEEHVSSYWKTINKCEPNAQRESGRTRSHDTGELAFEETMD